MSKSKLTPEQIKEIAFSELTYLKIAEIYKTSMGMITKIKKNAGTNKGQGTNLVGLRNKITPEQMANILDMNNFPSDLAKKYGLTIGYIYQLRSRQKENKVKRIIKPVIVKVSTIKKLSPMKKSKYEEDNEIKAKAIKAKELYNSIEEKKKESGFKWITRIGKYGIKETVFIKQ